MQYGQTSGAPAPLGASFDGTGVNFAVFSANAERIELCLFENGAGQETRIALSHRTGDIWHGYLEGARPGLAYGYRAYGPYDPSRGHRFNPHKLLSDPYARLLRGSLQWRDEILGYVDGDPLADLSLDTRDSAPFVPKSIVVQSSLAGLANARPGTAWRDSLIYEAHVKGMTQVHPDIAPGLRGKFAGFAQPKVIDHLLKLGVTAVELLPVQAFVDERSLAKRCMHNYWGYNTLGFFAPHAPYLAEADNPYGFRTMVEALHSAGIEVILDVVYNHTAESEELGPTLCFRGLDNASYYWLQDDDPRRYVNVTGTGNTFNMRHRQVRQLVIDSLRYWTDVMGVDGFRFDLTTALIRDGDEFGTAGGFLDMVAADPVLSRVKLIAEPWDIGPDGYRLGTFPKGWAEWNDRYRDTVRAFWRGDEKILPELASRLLGSADLFEKADTPEGARPAWTSVNFITAHDGFTLADLVSYDSKHNESNGEDNRDGSDHNLSANYGVEGPTGDEEILRIRRRQMRNMLATLLLSRGTPMIAMGDEIGRSQGGNNNAYVQDNASSWMDWAAIDGEALHQRDLVGRLAAIRRRFGQLRPDNFQHGTSGEGDDQAISWLRPDGSAMGLVHWSDPATRAITVIFQTADAAKLVFMLNASRDPVDFTAPLDFGAAWLILMDTSHGDGEKGNQNLAGGSRLAIPGLSFILLVEMQDS